MPGTGLLARASVWCDLSSQTVAGPPRRLAFAVAAAGAAVLLLGVAAVVGSSVVGTEGGQSLTAEIDQRYRFDEASGVMPVLLRNSGDEPVTVTRLELVAPSVVTEPEVSEIIVRPGWTRRIRLPLQPSRCPEQGAPSSGPATVVVTVDSSGDADREIRLSAPDPEDLLESLARADCAVQRVLRVADFGFGPQWRRTTDGGEPLLRAHMVIARRAAGPPVTVTGIRGSIVVAARATSAPPWHLDPGDRRVVIPVEFRASRCDLHALIESKKRFVISTWAKLSGGEEQHLELRPDPGLEAQLRQLLADACQSR